LTSTAQVYGGEMKNPGEDAPVPFPLFLLNPDLAAVFEAHRLLVSTLEEFDAAILAPYVAGLLTCPEWQASTVRLEMLQHLVVAAARGRKRPKAVDLKSWLTELGEGIAGQIE